MEPAATDLTPEEITANLHRVRENIVRACLRSGRAPKEVTLVAVSKTKPSPAIAAAFAAGARDFGENYVQELTRKWRDFDGREEKNALRWHMIGHLQRNKVRPLIGHTALIHAVDSLPLAGQISAESVKKETVTEILLEVNVAEEESKWGFRTEAVSEAARAVSALPGLRLLGLMTSAPWTEDPETNRPYFRRLRELAFRLKEEGRIAESVSGIRVPALSMGMSGDYTVAVEEGATLVRVGTDIFGRREYPNGK